MERFDSQRLEEALQTAMREAGSPALAITVVDREGLRYARGFGTTATDASGQPVTSETLFRIGSTTKPLTSLLILNLVEDDLLDLDATLANYLPEVRLHDPDAAKLITIRSLLAHRSGLPPGGEELGHAGTDALTAFVRETLPAYELVAPPNLLFSYSNPGYSLLGYLAEQVTGVSYAHLMRERVFAPAGMERTTFDPLVALTYPFALPHLPAEDDSPQVLHQLFDDPAGWPAGFAMSNLDDLANLARVLLNGGRGEHGRLLNEASVQEMLAPQADLLTATGTAYGLGVFLRPFRGARLVEHGGAIPTYESAFSLAPDAGLAIVVLANRPLGGRLATLVDRLWEELLALEPGPPHRPRKAAVGADLAGAEGAFLGKRRGLARLYDANGRVVVDLNGRELPLCWHRDRVFVATDADGREISVGIPKTNSGRVDYLLVDGEVCARTRGKSPSEPEGVFLERLAGRYRSFDEITIALEDNRLVLRSHMHGNRKMSCVSLGGLRFASDYGLLEFSMDDDGETNAVTVWDEFPMQRQET